MKPSLSVIIPTLNNHKGLEYLLNYFKDKPYKVIVVDNKKKNLGFAEGVNKGAKDVKTKWMLILNDDIEFEYQISNIKYQKYISKIKNNPIEELIHFAESNKLNAVSPILVNPVKFEKSFNRVDLNGEVENYGYKVLPNGKIELIKNPKQILNTKYKILNTNLDGLTAACLLVKTKVFKELKGFDESFFAYLEDVDFFIRFKEAGYKMAISGNIKVLHNHMTTSKTMGNFKTRQDMVNWWRLYFKHKEKFKFDFKFIIERLRNISGFLKATFSSLFYFQKNLQE